MVDTPKDDFGDPVAPDKKPSDPTPAPGAGSAPPPTPAPGRRPGSTNKTRPVEAPRQTRKQPEDIQHPAKALKRLHVDAVKLTKRHNEQNPENKYAMPPPPQKEGAKQEEPIDVVEAVEAGILTTLELVGEKMELEARPKQKSVHAAAQSYVNLAQYFMVDVDPVWVAAGTAIMCTGSIAAPMLFEYLEKRKKEKEEEGEVLGHDKAENVKVDKKPEGER